MTISYPVTLPSTPQPASFVLKPRTATALTMSPTSFRQRAYDWGGDVWQADVSLPAMKRSTAGDWLGAFAKLKGTYGTFYLPLPTGAGAAPRGIGTGTPLVNGASQTGETLITDGWTAGQTGILKAGDFFQLETRLYMVVTDANSDGSGNATFDIWPRLRSAPANNAALTVSGAKGIFRLAAPVDISIDTALVYGISFSAMEDPT